MKLGCDFLIREDKSLDAGVRRLYDAGFDLIEIIYEHPFFYGNNYPSQGEVLKKLMKELGVRYTIHAPFSYEFFSHKDPVFRRYLHKMLEKSMLLAERVDSKIVVMHGGIIPSMNRHTMPRGKSIELFVEELRPPLGMDNGVKLCIENLDRDVHIGQTLQECKQILDTVPGLGFCWDVPHSFITGQMDAFMDSGIRIDHVHIADSDGVSDGHMALGEGKVPFKRVKDFLKQKNYPGSVILETLFFDKTVKSRDYWDRL